MDGTFTQCFPRHVQELFARTCVTSLILALSRVSCGGDFLPYRLWKKGNTILWAGNTQKISNTGAFTCSTVQTTSFHVRAWCVPGLQGQAEGGLQASAAVLSGRHGFCHIQARVYGSHELCVLPHLSGEHQPGQVQVVLCWNHKRFLLTCNIYGGFCTSGIEI